MSFHYSPKVVTNGLVLYLDAGNPTSYVSGSTNWKDLSRSALSGSLINGPTFSSSNGGSIVFDGSNDTVFVPFILDTTSSFTISTIAKCETMTTESANRQTVCSFNNGITTGFQILSLAIWGESLTMIVGDGTSYSSTNILATNIQANNWHVYTVVSNNNTYYGYIDGVLKNSFKPTYTGISAYYRLASRGGGQSGVNQNWNGKISTTQIYNRALSAQEVLQNYNATKGRFGLT